MCDVSKALQTNTPGCGFTEGASGLESAEVRVGSGWYETPPELPVVAPTTETDLSLFFR